MFELASKKGVKVDVAIDPASVAANSVAIQTFTVKGLQPDMRILAFDAPFADVGVCQSYVSGANELSVMFVNPTAGAINPTAVNCRIIASKV